MNVLISTHEYLRGFFTDVKVLSLCCSLPFGMLSCELSCFGFSVLPVFISSIRGVCWALPDSSSLCHGLKTVSWTEQSYHSPHLFCFQGIAVLCCLIFSALQTVVSYILSMLYCFRWDGKVFFLLLYLGWKWKNFKIILSKLLCFFETH